MRVFNEVVWVLLIDCMLASHVCQSANARLLTLQGTPAQLSKLRSLVSDTLRDHMDKFISPTPPERLKFVCIRHGGPLSVGNPNPVCRGANQKVPPSTKGVWSDLPIPAELTAPANDVDVGEDLGETLD